MFFENTVKLKFFLMILFLYKWLNFRDKLSKCVMEYIWICLVRNYLGLIQGGQRPSKE